MTCEVTGRHPQRMTTSFPAFLGDFTAVLATVEQLGLVSPVLVGHSLGADLIVHCASRSPAAPDRLVLIDGANPMPEPFLTNEDLAEFTAMFASAAEQEQSGAVTGGCVLTATDVLELNVEIDVVRAGILAEYRAIDVPIRMIMSTAMVSAADR